jgi:hypothetical protein
MYMDSLVLMYVRLLTFSFIYICIVLVEDRGHLKSKDPGRQQEDLIISMLLIQSVPDLTEDRQCSQQY